MAFFDVAPFSPASIPVGDDFDARAYVDKRARELGSKPEVIRGPRRYQQIVKKRRIIARELRSRDVSYPEIGRAMGRDHSTIISLLNGRTRK